MYTMNIYLKLIAISFRSQLQYRASFFMLAIAHFFSTFVDMLGIWILFEKFKIVNGWSLAELSLIYGVIQMGFAIAESTARGFDSFGVIIKNGDFDRLLLRPIGTFLQVASQNIQLMRVGRFLQGFVVLIWGFNALDLNFFSLQTVILFSCIVGTSCLFYALFVVQAIIAFWTTETLELMNIFTFGGMEAGQYPLSIYKPPFRLFFTFVIPLACVAYYPIASILKQEFPLYIGLLFPLFGVAFLGVAMRLWEYGVRHYHSTGS